MKKILSGITFKGQPLYEEWNEDKTQIRWSSRSITTRKDGSWRVTDYPLLKTIKVDRRRTVDVILAQVKTARMSLINLVGVQEVH